MEELYFNDYSVVLNEEENIFGELEDQLNKAETPEDDLSKLNFAFDENEKLTNGFINKVIAKCDLLEQLKKDVGEFFAKCIGTYVETLKQNSEQAEENLEQLNKEAQDAMSNAAEIAQLNATLVAQKMSA